MIHLEYRRLAVKTPNQQTDEEDLRLKHIPVDGMGFPFLKAVNAIPGKSSKNHGLTPAGHALFKHGARAESALPNLLTSEQYTAKYTAKQKEASYDDILRKLTRAQVKQFNDAAIQIIEGLMQNVVRVEVQTEVGGAAKVQARNTNDFGSEFNALYPRVILWCDNTSLRASLQSMHQVGDKHNLRPLTGMAYGVKAYGDHSRRDNDHFIGFLD